MLDPSLDRLHDQLQNLGNPNISWEQRATMALASACQANRTITYAELADTANIPNPKRIKKLTSWLEQTIREDHAARAPLRAALVISRNRDGLPAPGFFLLCDELGLYQGTPNGPDAAQFYQATVNDLFSTFDL